MYNIYLSGFKRLKGKGHIGISTLFPSNPSIHCRDKTIFSMGSNQLRFSPDFYVEDYLKDYVLANQPTNIVKLKDL